MSEIAGATALEEAALDRLLAQEAARAGLVVTDEDANREERVLLESVARGGATPEQAGEALEAVRRSRGLGPARYRALLRRTATLRALVAPTVDVEPGELRGALHIRFGPRYQARVIVMPTEREAAGLRSELASNTDPEALRWRFATAAMRMSIDPSASRGGLLEPVSPADPAYPTPIRSALPGLEPGVVSPVLALDRGYALLLLEEVIPADPAILPDAPPPEVAATVEAEVRARKERVEMDALARRLLKGNVRVMDRALDWPWSGRGETP